MKKENGKGENKKSFAKELTLIGFFERLKKTECAILDAPNCSATITKEGGGLNLDISCRSEETEENENEAKRLSIVIKNRPFIIKVAGYTSKGTSIGRGSVSFEESFPVRAIQSANFDETHVSKFRCFFPIPLNTLPKFHYVFETLPPDDKSPNKYDAIRLRIDEKTFDIFRLKEKKIGYLVIESHAETNFDDFDEACFAIQQTLGFFTGYMPGGGRYVFTAKREVYYSDHYRPEINANYTPINTNPYSKDSIKREIADSLYGNLTLVSSDVASSLAEKIRNNPQFSAVIMLLLESSSVRSLLLIPSIFSVIVEALSKLISEPEQGKWLPIPEKDLENKVKGELLSVINSHQSEVSAKALSKLKNRISHFNKPVIKERLTNDEKLTRPFEQLKIDLFCDDYLAIQHRNDLLHGDILMVGDAEKSINEINSYMGYVSAKLYTLISKLILKYVGFSGYVYNHAKHQEKFVGKDTIEEYYQKI